MRKRNDNTDKWNELLETFRISNRLQVQTKSSHLKTEKDKIAKQRKRSSIRHTDYF